jgi:hypothetical protein
MNRLLGQSFAVITVGALATAFTPACAENDQSIFIRQALAPAQNRQNGMCVYTDDPTQTFISEGTLDVVLSDTYVARLLVGNQLIQRGNAASTAAEPNRAHVNGAVVRVTDANGATISEFTSLGSAFVDPQINNISSFAPLFVTALDPATTGRLRDEIIATGQAKLVIANIKAFGKTLGGVDLESGEFQFPIRLCSRCLLSFATGDDPAIAGVDCQKALEGSSTEAPCAIGQDEITPCEFCRDRLTVCQAP